MSDRNFHSIHITKDKCIGCVHCMSACPTRAIRVENGKARIIDQLCIDCAECLRVCPHDAVHSHTTSFASLEAFDYKVAIPSTVLYGQFGPTVLPNEILSALRRVGFDEVYDLSSICELNCAATEEYLNDHPRPRPYITATCPVVVRIIQRRYPSLCGQILPIEPPREIAAKILRTILPKSLGIPAEKIGIIHITPCPAKMVSINSPATLAKSYLDGAISIRDIFPQILKALRKSDEDSLMRHLFPETLFSGHRHGLAARRRRDARAQEPPGRGRLGHAGHHAGPRRGRGRAAPGHRSPRVHGLPRRLRRRAARGREPLPGQEPDPGARGRGRRARRRRPERRQPSVPQEFPVVRPPAGARGISSPGPRSGRGHPQGQAPGDALRRSAAQGLRHLRGARLPDAGRRHRPRLRPPRSLPVRHGEGEA
ncbi:MAG: 4Fe-4S binding protein [Candidatus Moduliflexus flocculans]|nr:4Fe-4S binding protein [Candidatus Moduliflexus flocculans]